MVNVLADAAGRFVLAEREPPFSESAVVELGPSRVAVLEVLPEGSPLRLRAPLLVDRPWGIEGDGLGVAVAITRICKQRSARHDMRAPAPPAHLSVDGVLRPVLFAPRAREPSLAIAAFGNSLVVLAAARDVLPASMVVQPLRWERVGKHVWHGFAGRSIDPRTLAQLRDDDRSLPHVHVDWDDAPRDGVGWSVAFEGGAFRWQRPKGRAPVRSATIALRDGVIVGIGGDPDEPPGERAAPDLDVRVMTMRDAWETPHVTSPLAVLRKDGSIALFGAISKQARVVRFGGGEEVEVVGRTGRQNVRSFAGTTITTTASIVLKDGTEVPCSVEQS